MKRRILLVDDEVAVLLTLKAVLEISGFDVDTAASAREGKTKLRSRAYHMVITDMRMESESSGEEVIAAARAAAYKPAIALLTAFPVNDDTWQEGGADKLLVKPMQTRVLLQQIEQLFLTHEAKRETSAAAELAAATWSNGTAPAVAAKQAAAKKSTGKKPPSKTANKRLSTKPAAPLKTAKTTAKQSTQSPAAKPAARRSPR
jgi:DNA-binding response OmpR family regulator